MECLYLELTQLVSTPIRRVGLTVLVMLRHVKFTQSES